MKGGSHFARLKHMIEAIDHICAATAGMDLDGFERHPIVRAAVERFLEIISEASRHLPADLKSRHQEIEWQKIAGIGNVLRHDDEPVAAAILWTVLTENLEPLEKICKSALERDASRVSRRNTDKDATQEPT